MTTKEWRNTRIFKNSLELANEYCRRARYSQYKGFLYLFVIFILFILGIYLQGYSRQFAIDDVEASEGVLEDIEASESVPRNSFVRPAEFYDIASCGGTSIVVGRRGLIRVSKNNGATWKDSDNGKRDDLYAVAFSGDCGVVITVGAEGAILVSTDDGSTWDAQQTNTGNDFNEIALSDDGRVAIAVGDRGLFRFSADGGVTWSPPDNNVTGKHVNDVALSGDGHTAVAVGNDNVIRISLDGGKNWIDSGVGVWPKSGGRDKDDFEAVALRVGEDEPAIAAVVAGDRGALLFSPDVTAGKDAEWTRKTGKEKEPGRSFEDVAFSGNTAVAVGRRGDIWTSVDGGRNWDSPDGRQGNTLNAVVLGSDGGIAVAVGRDGTILVSEDKEKKVWKPRNSRTKSELEAVAFGVDEKTLMIRGRGEGESDTILRSESTDEKNFPEMKMIPLKDDTRAPPQSDVVPDDSTPDNGSSGWLSGLGDKESGVLTYLTLLRGITIFLFIFMAQHLFGLARYEFRLAAFYQACGDAVSLTLTHAFSRSGSIDEFDQLLQSLSPDNLELRQPPRIVMDRMRQMMDWFIATGRGGRGQRPSGPGAGVPGSST